MRTSLNIWSKGSQVSSQDICFFFFNYFVLSFVDMAVCIGVFRIIIREAIIILISLLNQNKILHSWQFGSVFNKLVPWQCLLYSQITCSRSLLQGFKNQTSSYTLFGAPSIMFAYTIVHPTFCVPQIVVCVRVSANVYLAVHLLQRQNQKVNFLEQNVNVWLIPLTINPGPSLHIHSVLQRTKQQVFIYPIFESNEHGRSFPVFVVCL